MNPVHIASMGAAVNTALSSTSFNSQVVQNVSNKIVYSTGEIWIISIFIILIIALMIAAIIWILVESFKE